MDSTEEFRRELEIANVRIATTAVFYRDSDSGGYKLTISRPDHRGGSSFGSQSSESDNSQAAADAADSEHQTPWAVRMRVTCVPALLHQLAMLHWQRPSILAVNDTAHCRPEVDSVLLELLHPQEVIRNSEASTPSASSQPEGASTSGSTTTSVSASSTVSAAAAARVLAAAAGIHSAALDNSFQRHEATRASDRAAAAARSAAFEGSGPSIAEPGTPEFDAAIRAFADRMQAAGNRGTGPMSDVQMRILDIAAGLGAAPSIEAFDKHLAEDAIDTELEGAMLARWVITRWRAWDEESDGKHVVRQKKTAKVSRTSAPLKLYRRRTPSEHRDEGEQSIGYFITC